MPRTATTLALALTAFTTTPTAWVAAQEPRSKAVIYALVEDPAGNPVQGARGWLAEERPRRLAALPDLDPAAAAGTPAAWPEAESDARGLLRFGGDDWQPGAGSGLVTTARGLGAVLPRLFARRLQQVTLEPMAEVSTATGSEPFTLYARARLADGRRVALPQQRGQRVRLPAGDYELWAQSVDGWSWQRLVLRPGGRATIAFDGPAQRLALPEDAFVHPDGWPTMPLRARGGATELLLRGAALDASLVTWTGESVTPAQTLPKPPTVAALPWPPANDAAVPGEPFEGGLPGAVWYGLVQEPGGFRLVARGRADDRGRVLLPRDPGGDSWLLATGAFAPLATPWSARGALAGSKGSRGVEFALQARDRQGLPVVDLVCTFTPSGMDAAAVEARTDGDGVARFGLVRGPGDLTVDDPRYANQRIELADVPTRTFQVAVERGATCSGQVTFADGDGDDVVVVTLRDPTGTLRPAVRTQAVRCGEGFRFSGLDVDADLVLFATATREGKTWSARRLVRSGGGDVKLVLADEDPDLGR